MLRDPALRPNGDPIGPDQMAEQVLERGPNSMVRVCARVENRGKVKLGSSPANRIFDVEPEQQPRKWLLSLDPAISGKVLESHYISYEAWQALVGNDPQAFVEQRIQTLMHLERAFMEAKGVRVPKSYEPAPSAIDVEDEVPLRDSSDFEMGQEQPLPSSIHLRQSE
jgi:hypothetical protein